MGTESSRYERVNEAGRRSALRPLLTVQVPLVGPAIGFRPGRAVQRFPSHSLFQQTLSVRENHSVVLVADCSDDSQHFVRLGFRESDGRKLTEGTVCIPAGSLCAEIPPCSDGHWVLRANGSDVLLLWGHRLQTVCRTYASVGIQRM